MKNNMCNCKNLKYGDIVNVDKAGLCVDCGIPYEYSRSKIKNRNRKEYPVYSGFIKYFPDAILEVAHLSFVGNEQHHPGQPLHWDKNKSTDNADAQMRHLIDDARGIKFDDDKVRHLTKNAWRAMAILQRELDKEKESC